MKHRTISLRRRHLLMAGLAGIAAPATLFAGQRSRTPGNAPAVAGLLAEGSGSTHKLVVSGRILGALDSKPLAGAVVEVWQAGAHGDDRAFARGAQNNPGCPPCASVTTDADGRFMVATLDHAGPPRHIYYRVNGERQATRVTRLDFAPARGVPDHRSAQLQRDEAGTWRATFGVTLA